MININIFLVITCYPTAIISLLAEVNHVEGWQKHQNFRKHGGFCMLAVFMSTKTTWEKSSMSNEIIDIRRTNCKSVHFKQPMNVRPADRRKHGSGSTEVFYKIRSFKGV
jgi:hypothetical protein